MRTRAQGRERGLRWWACSPLAIRLCSVRETRDISTAAGSPSAEDVKLKKRLPAELTHWPNKPLQGGFGGDAGPVPKHVGLLLEGCCGRLLLLQLLRALHTATVRAA